jgi:glyoxylate/hydroxypyruvate reductase
MRIHVQNHEADPINGVTPDQWGEAVSRAGERGEGHAISFGTTADEFAAAMRDAEALITTARVISTLFPAEAPKLRLIFLTHAGIDPVIGEAHRLPPGAVLLNNSGAHSDKAGEYVVMAVLMLANHVPRFIHQQHREVWDKEFASGLAGRRITIVGLGSLGGGAAKRLRWFDPHITGVRMHRDPHPACDRVVTADELDEVLPKTEFLVLACPSTPRTFELLNRRRVELLPRGAGVVNIGRGELIEQDAVLDALDSGHLSGAVLDVFTPEPVPPGHRLWHTRNLVMTPHMSAADPLTYNLRTLAIFFENLAAYSEGRPLPNRVDLSAGY